MFRLINALWLKNQPLCGAIFTIALLVFATWASPGCATPQEKQEDLSMATAGFEKELRILPETVVCTTKNALSNVGAVACAGRTETGVSLRFNCSHTSGCWLP